MIGDKQYITDNEHLEPIEVPVGAPDIELVYMLGT
jgi:hypothetical protein